ncbi:MAG TPA: amidohydrolase [Candidatus Eisenbacteria bacterium]|nr:amidohydrolase [Candidatus Eisenbacteria bacterium]
MTIETRSFESRTFSQQDVLEMTATRRDFHAHPETAFEEVRTSRIVAERLRALGLEPETGIGRTGVMATIEGGRAGRTVLLRADMDALPIQEENDTPYRSGTPGRMHACGHDCHTSILLTVAKQLVREADRLAGTVRLCFQPAEEQGGGALAMIKDGALAPKPDAAFGLHVWQDMDVGEIGVPVGPWLAAVDEFNVTLRGRGAHGAAPHQGVDPVLAVSHVIASLQSIVSRNVDPLREAVVSVTQVRAGTAFNIIPDHAWMNGTVRTFDDGVWQKLPEQFERVVRGVAQGFGCEADIEYIRHNRPTVNDAKMAEVARAAAAEVVGRERVRHDTRTMGGEDFSWFLAEVPGCFVAIGSRNASKGLTFAHHHPRFDVDERCLELGAETLLRITRRFLAA